MRNNSSAPQKSRSERMRDDVCLVVCIFAGVGLIASAYSVSAWPFLVALILDAVIWGVMIREEIKHERSIETMREAGDIEVRRITANQPPAPSTPMIDGYARLIPNVMGPQPQLQVPPQETRKLIENGVTTLLPPKYWTYTLPDGTQARGDLIAAIANASFDERDDAVDLRDYVRAQYHVEFSNKSYSAAIKALQLVGALDANRNWQVSHEQVSELLGRMVNTGAES